MSVKSMLNEFKAFAMRGNVVDMAVGIIIGASFGKIVNSMVNDVLMPPLGLLLGKMDFSSLFINLSGAEYTSLKAAKDAGAPTINYGLFLNTVIDFVIMAFVIFMLIKFMNKLQKPAPVAAPSTKECPQCTSLIPLKAKKCPMCTADIK